MKNAIMFHGGGETPESFWFPSIRRFLESQGYNVWSPQLWEPIPEASQIDCQLDYSQIYDSQLDHVLENGKFDENTALIGHSAGCSLALDVLENINVRIKRAILVSVSYHPFLNWRRIRKNIMDIYFINSDNDPYGFNHIAGMYMLRKLGGTLIVPHGQGHMGSTALNQPYREFPLLEKLLSLP